MKPTELHQKLASTFEAYPDADHLLVVEADAMPFLPGDENYAGNHARAIGSRVLKIYLDPELNVDEPDAPEAPKLDAADADTSVEQGAEGTDQETEGENDEPNNQDSLTAEEKQQAEPDKQPETTEEKQPEKPKAVTQKKKYATTS